MIGTGMRTGPTDWAAWSREAVAMMQQRNDAWTAQWELTGARYAWDLDSAELVFERPDIDVVADLCCIRTTSDHEGTFLWSWANEVIPRAARNGVELVREFGERNDLPLLTTPEWHGGEAEGKEMAAVAGRVIDAEGVWIERNGDLTLFFTLSRFRTRPR
jgi:hypothetical protein